MECAAHSVRAGEVSWRGLCTHTQGMKVQAHVLYFISSFFFVPSFLLALSCLSVSGGRWQEEEEEEEGFHCVSVEPLFQSS